MLRSKTIAKLLHICRELTKMSQQDLAQKLNVDRTLISKIENGKASVSPKLLLSWIDATYNGWRSVINDRQVLERIQSIFGNPKFAI